MRKIMIGSKPRIGWVADFVAETHPGGAQVTNKMMVDYGQKLGHEIDYITPATGFPGGYVLFILNNIVHFQSSAINRIVNREKYARYEHDYDAAKLIRKWPGLYDRSLVNIFLSPLHLSETERILGGKVAGTIIPSPIDTKLFRNAEKRREKGSALLVGNIVPEKGLENVLRYLGSSPETKVYVAGFNIKNEFAEKFLAHNRVEYLGKFDYQEMPEVYNRFESLIHLPKWKEPFGRVVVEAYLCGCSLIVNDNVGAASYDWDWREIEGIKKKVQTRRRFWDTIEKVLK